MIEVDTPCHKIPNFIETAKRAGVPRVFIGLETVNPDNLAAVMKRRNSINEILKRAAGLKGAGHHDACRKHSWFPVGHAGTIRRHAIIQEELPVDVVEFFSDGNKAPSEHQGKGNCRWKVITSRTSESFVNCCASGDASSSLQWLTPRRNRKISRRLLNSSRLATQWNGH
jgi:hypothetical protein